MPRIIKIGRSNKNTIIVDIEHRKISREHAEIIKIGEEEYLIKDLNSTHGTFVNDIQLNPNVGQHLRAGDELRFGDQRFILE